MSLVNRLDSFTSITLSKSWHFTSLGKVHTEYPSRTSTMKVFIVPGRHYTLYFFLNANRVLTNSKLLFPKVPHFPHMDIHPIRIKSAMIHSRAPLGGRIIRCSQVSQPYLFREPKSGTWGTVTYAKSHGKQMASSFGRKSLLCFYCNKRSSVKYDGIITQWECGRCDAMNYLDAVSF